MPQKPESRLQKKMVKRLREGGAWAEKTHGGPYSAGLPDIVGVADGIGFGVEAKLPGKEKTLTDLQRRTLLRIKEAGGVAVLATKVETMDAVLEACKRRAGRRVRVVKDSYE